MFLNKIFGFEHNYNREVPNYQPTDFESVEFQFFHSKFTAGVG